VLGARVQWPSYPSGEELKVTWELEPAHPAEGGEHAASSSKAEESRTDKKLKEKAEKKAG